MKIEDLGKPLEAETPAAGVLWGLYFALYTADPSVILAAPRSVQDAYSRVQRIHLSLPD